MIQLTWLQTTPTWMVCILMFLAIILFYRAGHFLRKRILVRNPEHATVELSTVIGILLGLLGLLLAFTFSMSNSRYDHRKEVIIEEANKIGTAILRADLYPDSIRSLLRENFRLYVESRIHFIEAGMNIDQLVLYSLQADSLSSILWRIVTEDARVNNVVVRSAQMIPALNDMIDITTTRRSAGESSIPDSIMYFLFAIALCSSFLIGYDSKGRLDRIMVLGFATIISMAIFMIIDLDRPRSGFIDMARPNQKIIELRNMF